MSTGELGGRRGGDGRAFFETGLFQGGGGGLFPEAWLFFFQAQFLSDFRGFGPGLGFDDGVKQRDETT